MTTTTECSCCGFENDNEATKCARCHDEATENGRYNLGDILGEVENETAADPFAGIVDVPTNDGWDT